MRPAGKLVATRNPAGSNVYKYSKDLAFIFHADLVALIDALAYQANAQDIAREALPCELHCLAFSYPAIRLWRLSVLAQSRYGTGCILV